MRGRVAVALLLVALTGCTGGDDRPRPAAGPGPSGTAPSSPGMTGPGMTESGTPSEGATSPSEAPTPSVDPLPVVDDPLSLPALMAESYDGGRLRVVRTVAEAEDYTRSEVTYRSDGLRISGVLLRPRGAGPFPAVVLNHGYIEPSVYVTGQGLAREQEYLARAGYVVLHTDYRGHAGSDAARPMEQESRIGYIRDAINAVHALRALRYVDGSRLAMLGRSMGGGVTLGALVAQPGLVDAAVVYASVSSSYLENLRHFTERSRPAAAEEVYRRYGRGPAGFRQLSPRAYFDRITEPVLMHHGTEDEQCPAEWAQQTQRRLVAAGVDSQLEMYAGERHVFGPRWQASIERTVRFLDRRLGVRTR